MTGGADAIRSDRARTGGVTLKAFCIVMVDGYDTLMMSFLAPLLKVRYGLAPTDIGRIFAIGYLGAIVGAMLMGPIADRVGRRPMLIVALLIAASATGLCATADDVDTLLVLRFFAGVGLGGALPAVIALTAENAAPERRRGTVTLMYIGFPFGAVVGGALTSALLDVGIARIFIAAATACLLAATAAWSLPRQQVAAERPAPSMASGGTPAARGMFLEQFAERRLWPALTLWIGLFSTLVLTYFLISWTPSLIVANGGSPRLAALGPVLLNLGGIVGALAMSRVLDRYGPYLPTACLALVGAGMVALVGQGFGVLPLLMIGLFVTGACVLGAQLNFPAMTADLFPAHVRSAGTGWTVAFGRVGSILGPLIGGWLIASKLEPERLFLVAAMPALLASTMLFVAAALRRRTASLAQVPETVTNR